MFKNYLTIAWRSLQKNKLYASINVFGLVLGLAVYLFANLLVAYERSHDLFFTNSDRIFTVGSHFSPTANIGINETDGVYSAFAPFFEAEVENVEAVARTIGREYLLSVDNDHYYETVRFADAELLEIFDFTYLGGDASALDDPMGIVLNREMATKLFGTTDVVGRTVLLDHDHALRVRAVIEDLPPNTHLAGNFLDDEGTAVIATLEALNTIDGYALEGNWNNLSMGDYTYMLMPAGTTKAELQPQLDAIYERHFPRKDLLVVDGIKVRKLVEANYVLWDAIGLPILESIRILGLLVLIVAIVNYTNLATAQSLGRSREIGLRKTMGATRGQLVIQFLVESLFVAFIAMVIALALVELLIPLFNVAMDKGLAINHLRELPWLIITTVLVGVVAGAYPAYTITQASPINALQNSGAKGLKGGFFRSIMLGLQFSITIFMLAMVMVMFTQNQKIESASEIYPKSQIITLSRLGVDSLMPRLETLRNELLTIPGVTGVSYTSQLPFEQSNSQFNASLEATGEAEDFLLTNIVIDEQWSAVFDVPLLAGRFLDPTRSADSMSEDATAANVIVNQLALERLGFGTPEAALGRVFYDLRQDSESRSLTIVGVLPDQNYQGFHNQIKPTVFRQIPERFRFAAIRVEGVAMGQAFSAVEDVWEEIVPDYPIQSRFLDDEFNETFQVYGGLSSVLGGFAGLALLLSLIGLFGLAAFMAAGRTKEIGVRKVMGASMTQIVRLLIWQFSKPVLWSLLVALPLAFLAANAYLSFFAERISYALPIVGGAGMLAVVFAWIIVAIHATRVARANPIHALRYE
ncbi:MAG: FtsX-like permease family protein [Pseudomonadota bacterium]